MYAILQATLLLCNGLPSDAQAYCQAHKNAQPASCFSIQDPDARTACLAETGRNPAACWSIGDEARRQECMNRAAGVGGR